MRIVRLKKCAILFCVLFASVALMLNGMTVRKNPTRRAKDTAAKGRPVYEELFRDGRLRIAVFWGWDHPRDTIMGSFPAFETLNGKRLYYKGRPVQIEIGMITQVNDNPKKVFKKHEDAIDYQMTQIGIPTKEQLKNSKDVVYVEEYLRANGDVVRAHYRTKPDNSLANNLSYKIKQEKNNKFIKFKVL